MTLAMVVCLRVGKKEEEKETAEKMTLHAGFVSRFLSLAAEPTTWHRRDGLLVAYCVV